MRKQIIAAAVVSAALVFGSSHLIAEEMSPTTQPSEAHEAKPKPKKTPKLWGPYKNLKSLTSEQTEKILAIHEEFLAARKALEAKQEADILALLSDEQKAELNAIQNAPKEPKEDKKKEDKKADAD